MKLIKGKIEFDIVDTQDTNTTFVMEAIMVLLNELCKKQSSLALGHTSTTLSSDTLTVTE